jgi:hypothetical protein
MTLEIVNPDERYASLPLQAPPTTGYVHLAAAVEPTLARTPFPRRSRQKRKLLTELKALAVGLAERDFVTKATVYEAALIPPLGRATAEPDKRRASYDVAILVEATDTDALDRVLADSAYRELESTLSGAAPGALVMPARCIRMIADVDKSRDGLFLFNYFTAVDSDIALGLWEHLAAWYAAETAMDNSTLLAPLAEAPYVFVNHARWDRRLASFMAAQFTNPTFRSYVVANLRTNRTASAPILFHLA